MTSKITEFVERIGSVAEQEYRRGLDDGYERGHRDGYQAGYETALAEIEEAITRWLKKRVKPKPISLWDELKEREVHDSD